MADIEEVIESATGDLHTCIRSVKQVCATLAAASSGGTSQASHDLVQVQTTYQEASLRLRNKIREAHALIEQHTQAVNAGALLIPRCIMSHVAHGRRMGSGDWWHMRPCDMGSDSCWCRFGVHGLIAPHAWPLQCMVKCQHMGPWVRHSRFRMRRSRAVLDPFLMHTCTH